MKKLVLLFAVSLVTGCGEKSSSEGSDSASENPTASNESAEPSADTPKPTEDSATLSLSDADVERLLKEAAELDSLQYRDGLHYQVNESEPYSGWTKRMAGLGQVSRLGRFKDGKHDGLWVWWHENGQKEREATFKDGKPHGLFTSWHENGQKWEEETYKDGELVSTKYYNSKGEEVETEEEVQK
ncbi:MAG: hypothetical protein VCA55_14620 [Verrucomicrobiales bacterium]